MSGYTTGGDMASSTVAALYQAAVKKGTPVVWRLEGRATGHFAIINNHEFYCNQCGVIVPVGCLIYQYYKATVVGNQTKNVSENAPYCSRGKCREMWEGLFPEATDVQLLVCQPDAGCEVLHVTEHLP